MKDTFDDFCNPLQKLTRVLWLWGLQKEPANSKKGKILLIYADKLQAEKEAGSLRMVSVADVWRGDDGKYYRIELKPVKVEDELPKKEDVLKKLSRKEKIALGLV